VRAPPPRQLKVPDEVSDSDAAQFLSAPSRMGPAGM
jgi:hypothetical protein